MLGVLGQPVNRCGCLTQLYCVVGKSSMELDDLLGYRKGHLRTGFQVALLRSTLGSSDIEFYGYTQFSGGKIGKPSKNAHIEALRPTVEHHFEGLIGKETEEGLKENFINSVTSEGDRRLVKILDPGWESGLNPADKWPPGSGIPQWNLPKGHEKDFFVAAEVRGSVWKLANGVSYDVAMHNYNLPDSAQPATRVREYLCHA